MEARSNESIEPEVEAAEGDLSRWDYVTSVYDRDDCFVEPPTTQTVWANAYAGAAPRDARLASGESMAIQPRATAVTMATNQAPASAMPPVSHVAYNLMLDVTNPDSVFLPTQAITIAHPAFAYPLHLVIGPNPVLTRSMAQVMYASAFGENSHAPATMQAHDVARSHSNHSLERPLTLEAMQVRGIPLEALHPPLHTQQGYAPLHASMFPPHVQLPSDAMGCPILTNHNTTHTTTDVSSDKDVASSADTDASRVPPVAPSTGAKPRKICKPMSAYNYFYRDERINILNGIEKPGDPLPKPVSDFSQSKQEKLLHERWNVDPSKEKRRHRKMHGKIEFSRLSKVISRRWQRLPESGRDFYRQVARMDQFRYNTYMDEDGDSKPSITQL